MNTKYGAVGIALATLTMVTACGSQPAPTGAVGPSAVTCPAHPPAAAGLPPSQSGGTALVPPGPQAADICQYSSGKGAGMPGRATLTGTAATGLAAVLESANPITPQARRCDRPANLDPFAQEIIFSYASGRQQRVSVAFTDCAVAIVAASSQSGQLPLQTDADLFGYTALTTRRDGSTLAPDLIGLSATTAVKRARREHFTVEIDGAVLDPSVAAGTVVFQSPPADARTSLPGRDVDVILATGSAPACTVGQLALSYLGGGASAGNDFGTLVVRDSSARPCTLTGPLLVTGLAADGRPDTTAQSVKLSGRTVLTPNAGPIRWGPPGKMAGISPGELTGVIQLITEYRDGPASVDSGLCEPLWVVPVTWRVNLPAGSVLTVPNADPDKPGGLVRSGGFVTCRGRLGVIEPASVTSP